MRRFNAAVISLLIAIVSSLIPLSARATEFRVLPATATAHIGDVVAVAIQVDSATDLAGFQFDFSYVPTTLEVKTVAIAPAFEHLVKSSFDNVAGSGRVAAYRTTSPPVTGTNFTLATMEFIVKGSGTALVNIANHLLGAVGGDEILTNQGVVAGSFTVVGKTAAMVTMENLAQTYDGTAKAVVVKTVPPDLSVDITYDGSPVVPVKAGSYTVVAVVNDAIYSGSAIGTLHISGPYPFRIVSSTPTYYLTLAAAYLNAKENDIIELKTGDVAEGLIADRNVTVYIKGGFTDYFTPNTSDYTNVHGKMSVIAGRVIIEGICLK